jgi:hypothetical protein
MRACSKTATAPCCSVSLIPAKFASGRLNCFSDRRSIPRRNKMTDGFLCGHAASSAPKSVSAEMTVRLSAPERSKISESSARCSWRSRTWRASWPAARRPSASSGERELSTRNLTMARLSVFRARAPTRLQIAMLRGYHRPRDRDKPQVSPGLSSRQQSFLPRSLPGYAGRECMVRHPSASV